jgi:Zn-dependent M28 family amino/carboxypeptidase
VEVANLIVQWHPERKRRVLIATHYDTRPFPDNDLRDPRGEFIGANDGGSGTALLCQLGKHMPDLPGEIGVDFVLFDAEEFVFDQRNAEYFIGSTYFAKDYAAKPPGYRYEYGVLLDMIGDANLNLYFEKNSLQQAGQLTRSIWQTARRLRVAEFTPRLRHTVRDDHLPLNEIAKIPTCDIIDFDYPQPGGNVSYWHTQQDTLDKCSPLSLAKVGWVVHQWLQDLK